MTEQTGELGEQTVAPEHTTTPDGEAFKAELPPEEIERAKFLGWKSPDEWQGDPPPNGFMSAEDYLERADRFVPTRKLQEKVDHLTGLVEQNAETQRKMGVIFENQIKAQKERHQQALESARKVQADAFESGDKEQYERAREAENNLLKQTPTAQPAVPQIKPEVREALDMWRADKPWFGADQEKTQRAAQIYKEAEVSGITSINAILARVDHVLAEEAPKPAQRKTPSVGAGLSLGGGKAEDFDKLPSEAKGAFKKMVGQGLFEDNAEGRAQYTKDYNDA